MKKPEGVSFEIRQVEVSDLLPLRAKYLRQGLPPESASYAEDTAPTSLHFAALSFEQQIVGCLSIFTEPRPIELLRQLPGGIDEEIGGEFRIRGVATASQFRSKGIARALISAAEFKVLERDGRVLWCTARTPAVGFWQSAGFERIGEEFDMQPNGPHFYMQREIQPRT